MTIETEVAALTTQTTALLNAVNVQKTSLDTAVASTQTAADTVAGAFLTETVAAIGTVTLTGASATYQFIDPAGTSRDVVLPDLAAGDKKAFSVQNTGALGNTLTLKNAMGTAIGVPITNGFSLAVIWDGSAWRVL